jgi:hypothetical protein
MLGAARLAFTHMSDPGADDRIRFRDGARTVVILFTNVDDKTSGLRSSSAIQNQWENIGHFVNFFAGPNPTNSKGIAVPVHAISCPSGKSCGNGRTVSSPARIQAVVEAAGGLLADVKANSDYAPTQKQLLQRVVAREVNHYNGGIVLKNAFIGASLRVVPESTVGTCNKNPQTNSIPRSRVHGFDYDGASKTITFFGNCRPTPGSEVAVSYKNWEAWTPDE